MIFEKGDFVGDRYPVEIIDCLEARPNSELYLAKLKGAELKLVVKRQRIVTEKSNQNDYHSDFIRKEFEILSALRHPGIPRVIDFVCENGCAYMLMPYYAGWHLERWILENGAMPENSVLDISKNICEILMFLQERDKPILHNDIKPSNILLKEDGGIILLDFGLANYEGEMQEDVLFQGTLGYAAPECWHQNQLHLSKATDVFAFGATIYRLLTGEKPSERYGNFMICDGRKRENWQTIINKCCTLEAKYRYQNAAQILDALQRIQIK